jgi:hypothetical protein
MGYAYAAHAIWKLLFRLWGGVGWLAVPAGIVLGDVEAESRG